PGCDLLERKKVVAFLHQIVNRDVQCTERLAADLPRVGRFVKVDDVDAGRALVDGGKGGKAGAERPADDEPVDAAMRHKGKRVPLRLGDQLFEARKNTGVYLFEAVAAIVAGAGHMGIAE